MKQVFAPILAVTAFIVIAGFLTQGLKSGKIVLPKKDVSTEISKSEIQVNGISIPVEIADESEERALGLSGRESLEVNTGLLFIFDEKNVRPKFWMKDMNFSIDIIWIDDGHIVQIDSEIALSDPGTPDNELKLYIPNQPIDYVLEVNAGFSESNGFEVGGVVDLSGVI